MKRVPRAKEVRRAARAILVARAVAEADAARAEVAIVFQTKITASRRASRANRAGSFPFKNRLDGRGQGPRRTLLLGEAYDYNIPEAAERNEAHREAQNEGRKAR